MANILSLALKINADASGLRLTPVERALQRLGAETDKVTGVFDKFAGTSEVAARAQEATAKAIEDLTKARQAGTITAGQFAEEFQKVRDAALEEAAALQRAAQITEANLTPLQRYDRALEELDSQLQAGRISQETYGRAVEGAARGLTDAERAARGFEVATEATADNAARTTLQFNELSGVFAVLPGPLGNIAGRISGLASAGEGLSRVFAGGLRQGITNVAGSFSSLLTSTNIALGGIAAFGTAATAITRGLVDLEARVKSLGASADQLGVSFQTIQVLEEAAARAGTSIEAASAGIQKFAARIDDARSGTGAAAEAFRELGISQEELANTAPTELAARVAEELGKIEDPARRAALQVDLLGKSGEELRRTFSEIPGAADDLEKFGRAVSDLDRERLADFGGSIDALSLATEGLGTSLLLPFVGLGDGVARGLAEVTAGITAIVDPVGRILEPLLTQIGRIVELIGVNIGNLGRTIGAVFEPFAVVVQEVAQALEPLYEGIFNFLQSISNAAVSVTEWVVSFTPIGAIAANVGALGETISRVVTIVTTAFQRAGEFVGGLVSRFAELIAQSPFLQALGDVISSVFGSVASVFSTIANAIGGVVGRLLTIAENFLGIDRSAQQAAEATQNLGGEIKALTEEEQQAAAEREKFLQGFTDNVSKAIDESAKFGQAGFDAALEFEQALADLQEQANEGELNAEQYARGVANATAEFEKQIKVVEEVAKQNEKLAEEARKRAEAEAEAVQKVIDSSLEQLRIEQEFDGDSKRFEAAQNLLTIQEEIVRVEEQLRSAREASDQAAIDAATARLATLDQIAARERDIASGDAAEREAASKIAERSSEVVDKVLSDSQRFGDIVRDTGVELEFALQKAADSFNNGFISQEQLSEKTRLIQDFFGRQIEAQQRLAAAAEQEQFDSQLAFQNAIEEARRKFEAGILNEEAFDKEVARQEELYQRRQELTGRIFEAENRLVEQQFEIELERARELANTKTGSIEIQDIRSGNISAFFDTLKEDPAIAEAKRQTKELQNLRKEIAKLNAEKVDILAGTG